VLYFSHGAAARYGAGRKKPKHLPAAKHNIIVKKKKRISKIVVDHVR